MLTLTPVERAVLDGAVHASETLEQIYLRLHTPPAPVALADAADAVQSLVRKRLVELHPIDGVGDGSASGCSTTIPLWRASIEATSEGRTVLAEGPLPPPPGWPKGRIHPGIFRSFIPDLSAEEIDQARREMLGNFAE